MLKRALCLLLSVVCITVSVSLTSCSDKSSDKEKENKVSEKESEKETENIDENYSLNEIIDYSSSEEELEKMNGYAEILYNYIAEYAANQSTVGITKEDLFSEAYFADMISQNGIVLDSNTKTTSEGDEYIKEKYIKENKEKIIAYLGYPIDISGNDSFFVQVKRSNESEIIGQYPSPPTVDNYNEIEWTTGAFMENENTLEYLNEFADLVGEQIIRFIASTAEKNEVTDEEFDEYFDDTLSSEYFDEMRSEEGLYIDGRPNTVPIGEEYNYVFEPILSFVQMEDMPVYVYLGIGGDEDTGFYIHVRSVDNSEMIGQYPSPIPEEKLNDVEWGTFFEN